MPPRRIEVCLGSSCFARGGSAYPAVVQAWLASRGLEVEVRGRRCGCACERGPNLVIDGVEHRVPDAAAVAEVLDRAFAGTVPG
jgi:NADH:ubiquinone oxidoreductase subunit E